MYESPEETAGTTLVIGVAGWALGLGIILTMLIATVVITIALVRIRSNR